MAVITANRHWTLLHSRSPSLWEVKEDVRGALIRTRVTWDYGLWWTQENSTDKNRLSWAETTLGEWFYFFKRFFFSWEMKKCKKYLKTSKNYPRKLYYLDFNRSLFDPQNSRPHETENSLHGFRKCFIWEPFHVWCNNNIIKFFSLTAADWNITDKITWYPEFGPTYFDRCETNKG